MAEHAQAWALTGADAAEQRTHFFRAEDTAIYAPLRALEDRDTRKALVAQPAARGGILLIIEPPGLLAMPGELAHGFPVAPDLLAYAELRYRGTEQAREAAELLGVVFNMAGFGHVVPNAVSTPIEGGPNLPLAPLPLYVLLKLVAFSDRKAAKDLGGVLLCLEHYVEDAKRRYGVDHDGEGVPFEYTCAYLLGVNGQRFLDASLSNTVI